jgi:hypothetical protein
VPDASYSRYRHRVVVYFPLDIEPSVVIKFASWKRKSLDYDEV